MILKQLSFNPHQWLAGATHGDLLPNNAARCHFFFGNLINGRICAKFQKFELFQYTGNIKKHIFFSEQAYFLSGYKEQRVFYRNVLDVIPVLFEDGSHRLAAVYVDNRTTLIGFYRWNDSSEDFIDSKSTVLLY